MERLQALVERLARGPRALYALLALAWAALIFGLSARAPLRFDAKNVGRAWLSNLAHAPEYGVFAALLALAIGVGQGPSADVQSRAERRRARSAVALGLAALYAVSDEIHQAFVPGRDASVCDLATDLAGAWLAVNALGALLARDRARFSRVVALGTLACMLTALVATFLVRQRPAWTWL